jgi:hypothetical protein
MLALVMINLDYEDRKEAHTCHPFLNELTIEDFSEYKLEVLGFLLVFIFLI